MAKSKNVDGTVRGLAEPEVTRLGLILWDIAYEKHGGYSELTIYIDRPGGAPIGTDDCEAVSRAVEPLLDRYDPIEESYTFSVSSSGTERVLRTAAHFEASVGKRVECRLYKPRDGQKIIAGTLVSRDANGVTIKHAGADVTIAASDVAQVKTVEEKEDGTR